MVSAREEEGVREKGGSTWPTAALPDPAAAHADRMGASLDLANGLAVVGAPGTAGDRAGVSAVACLYDA